MQAYIFLVLWYGKFSQTIYKKGISWRPSGYDMELPLPGAQIHSLVRELRSHKLCVVGGKRKKKKIYIYIERERERAPAHAVTKERVIHLTTLKLRAHLLCGYTSEWPYSTNLCTLLPSKSTLRKFPTAVVLKLQASEYLRVQLKHRLLAPS